MAVKHNPDEQDSDDNWGNWQDNASTHDGDDSRRRTEASGKGKGPDKDKGNASTHDGKTRHAEDQSQQP